MCLCLVEDLSGEVKLFTKASERERFENMADVYALILCLEHCEKAYIRDAITAAEYF